MHSLLLFWIALPPSGNPFRRFRKACACKEGSNPSKDRIVTELQRFVLAQTFPQCSDKIEYQAMQLISSSSYDMDHISRSNARAREKDLNTYSKSKSSNEPRSNPKSTVDPIRLPFSGNLIGLRESEYLTILVVHLSFSSWHVCPFCGSCIRFVNHRWDSLIEKDSKLFSKAKVNFFAIRIDRKVWAKHELKRTTRT